MTKFDLDQALAEARDSVPRVWWALYQGAVEAGFEPVVAIALVKTWIMANGTHPTNKE